MKQFLLFLLFILCFTQNLFSQHVVFEDKNPLDFKMRVKQIDEFMQRFNLKEVPEIFLQEKDTLRRQELCITALFDFNQLKTRGDEVKEFVLQALNNSIHLRFEDENWRAIAHCLAFYQGKETEITLVLKTEHVKDYIYKWVICDASGKVLDLTAKRSNDGLRIAPTDNELNFMSLRHITKTESENIVLYQSKESKVNNLSVFMTLVSTGLLRIDHVNELEYLFSVENYDFTVKYFRREALNSGWLISDFHQK